MTENSNRPATPSERVAAQRRALETDLVSLNARLVIETGDRLASAKRRIIDVEAALAELPADDPADVSDAVVEAAVVEAPDNAMAPKTRARTKK